jgi:hypothetical protein
MISNSSCSEAGQRNHRVNNFKLALKMISGRSGAHSRTPRLLSQPLFFNKKKLVFFFFFFFYIYLLIIYLFFFVFIFIYFLYFFFYISFLFLLFLNIQQNGGG